MSVECSAGNIPPGYKQTEVGVIPQDWDIEPLRCDVTLLSGQHVLAQHCNTSGDGVPYLTGPADFPSGKIQLTKFTNRPTTLCKAGDILVTVKGSGSGTLVEADDSYCISRQLMAIRVKEWNAKFLFYSLLYNASKIKTSSTGLIPGLSRFDILDQEIPLPPTLAEQEAIAEALGDADAFIESLEQLISKKRQIKQGAMQELLTGKRRLPGFSGEWETKRLGDIAEIQSGGTPSTTQPQFWDGDVLWCTPTDITALKGHKYLSDTSRKITLQGLKCSSAEMIPAKSIVMTSRATIGECAINQVPVSTNQGFKNLIPFESVDVEFLYYLLLTKKQEFISLCGGSTFLEISKTQLFTFEVKLPATKEEQTAIATILSDMDSEITALEEKLAKASQIKQGMMQELLTGRIRLL